MSSLQQLQLNNRSWGCCSTSPEHLDVSWKARMQFAQAAAIPIRAAVPLIHHFTSVQRLHLWLGESMNSTEILLSWHEMFWCVCVCVCVKSDLSAPAHQWYVQHQENYEYIHRNPTFICFGFIAPWCCWCRQKSLEHVLNRSLHRGVWLVWSHCNVHVRSEDRISKAQAAEECCESFNAGTSADLWHLSTEDDLEIILSIILFCDAVKNFTPCAQDETWHFSNEELQFHQYKNFP